MDNGIAISLTVGLVSLVYGQTIPYDPLMVEPCTVFKSEHLVILDSAGRCEAFINALDYYSANGFQIKAVQGTSIYLQK